MPAIPAPTARATPLLVGGLRLATNLVLAPLAGYTDLAFRLCCRLQGGVGLAVTEVISAAALNRRVDRVHRFLLTSAEDRPLSVQIDGGQIAELVEAARRIEDAGHAVVDINMGCPVDKLTKKGGGSAWTTTPCQAAAAVAAIRAAVSIPVTAKIRLGWDDESITAPELARALAEAGVAAITVHGRTRAQGFSGRVRLDGIRSVVEAAPGVPVIGNGDVRSPEDAVRMLEVTGCAGVAIGRAALSDPWIFRDTWHVLRFGTRPPAPSFAERLAWVRRHFRQLCELMGPRGAVVRFRKAGCYYAGALGLDKEYRRRVSAAADVRAVETILDDVERGLHWRGEGRPEPAPIRVPQGPVDRW
ncbi:MAG: tRNA-dihydrouridine synthase [Planctomycetota bacterium]|nr:MAG: tRNA-dihydrouridine synthase [Planctomycetota bacterium]